MFTVVMCQSLTLVSVAAVMAASADVAPGDEETALCEQLRAQGAAPIPAYSTNIRVPDGLLELSQPSPSPRWSCVGPGGQ